MADITVDGSTFEVEDGTRLVLALERNGVDVLHRCGGYAGCTTCRVEFAAGEPSKMTRAEKEKLAERELIGVRLSCQIPCAGSMEVAPVMRVSTTAFDEPGPTPEVHITPDPEWVDVSPPE
jgi:ferredoxin